jgi:hypothetical protein
MPENAIHILASLISKGIRILIRIPENAIHILVSLCQMVFECRWEYLRMPCTSSLLFVEGYSNVDENTWEWHTHPRFSLSKGIRILMRIPENAVHILISLCRRVFECRWEYVRMPYTSSLLFVEGYSNVAENTWECYTHPRFSLSKGIRMSLRIPENAIHILVSLYRRVFECWLDYLKIQHASSFRISMNVFCNILSQLLMLRILLIYSNQ